MDRRFSVGVSSALIYEYESVLLRPGLIPAHIREADVDQLIEVLIDIAKPVAVRYLYRPTIRDADDELVFEAAYSAPGSIVTNNSGDFVGCERFGVPIYRPRDLADMLRPNKPGPPTAKEIEYADMAELLPSLRRAVERIAERENCSVDELINLAVAEKVAASDAEYLLQRKQAAQGSSKKGTFLLARIQGDEPPAEGDEMPAVAQSVTHKKAFSAGGSPNES